MLFKQDKSFFLTLDEGAKPVNLVLPEVVETEVPSAKASPAEQPSLVVAASEAPAGPVTAEPKAAAAAVQTTAEAIAAELAASQAARPAVTMSTYAPANLMPGTGLLSRKRRPGAGMKGFMTIAGDLFKS